MERLTEQDCLAGPSIEPCTDFEDRCGWREVVPVDAVGDGCSFGTPRGVCVTIPPACDSCPGSAPTGCLDDEDASVGVIELDGVPHLYPQTGDCTSPSEVETCDEADTDGTAGCGCACEFAAMQ